MATEDLYHVRITGLHENKPKLLDSLHSLGVMHLTQPDISIEEDLSLKQTEGLASSLLDINWTIEHLKKYAKSGCDLVFNEISVNNAINQSDVFMNKVKEPLQSALKKIEEVDRNSRKLHSVYAKIEGITLNIPKGIALPYESDNVYAVYARVSKKQVFTIPETLSASRDKEHLMVLGDSKKDVEKFLTEIDARIVTLPALEHRPENEQRLITARLDSLAKQKSKYEARVKILAARYFKEALCIQHTLEILHERYETPRKFRKTSHTYVVEGYIPRNKISSLKELAKLHKVHVEYGIDEKAPTKLKNNSYVGHFEFLTHMFGLPKYGKIDPTPFMSFFIPLFFGFMFSDIGYGILLLLLAVVLMKTSRRQNKVQRDGAFMLGVCSITTIIFGVFFGSFFGNLIKITPLILDPFTDAKLVLIIGLALGLIHLNLGLVLAMVQAIKEKDMKKLLLQPIPFITLQLAALGFLLNPPLGAALLIVTLILLFLKSKFQGIMDVTGFLGTWLSYARLLALGLATGGIAMGVNIIAQQLLQVNVLGPVLFIFTLLLGHTFNFAMNVLGSSIHSVRLHYIEFFSQFYEAGGEPFNAFTTNKLKEKL